MQQVSRTDFVFNEAEGTSLVFFNKAHCLVYGKFLKRYGDKCEVLYYKQPSGVYKVHYATLIKQLWATEISDHFPEDVKIKKLIANVNFGLLVPVDQRRPKP